MKPVIPHHLHDGAKLVMIAEDQDEYQTLPASVGEDGIIMSEWELTEDEIHRLMAGGRIRLWQHTFKSPMQPINLVVGEPECGFGDKSKVD